MSLTELKELSKFTDSFYYVHHNCQISDPFPGLLTSTIPDTPTPEEDKAKEKRVKQIIKKLKKRNDPDIEELNKPFYVNKPRKMAV